LLVEDKEDVRVLLHEVLRENGYSVLEACNGKRALDLGKHHLAPIQLLITDVVMPKMSGRELADRLASTHPETKVLYMSGYTDGVIAYHGELDPDTAFLQKPFSPNTLAHKIRDVLDN